MHKNNKQETLPESSLYANGIGVAKILGKGKSWFYENLEDLERQGFPQKDPLMNEWLISAVIQWNLMRHGVNQPIAKSDEINEDPFMTAARCFNA